MTDGDAGILLPGPLLRQFRRQARPGQDDADGGLDARGSRRGLTQEELDGRSGISARAIREIENGRNVPTDETVQRLSAALGLAPAQRALFLRVAGRERERRHRVAAAPTNLPELFTDFVGRAAEIDEICRALDAARLVTLAGPGGAGKTRLALRVAHALRPAFPDGAWLARLDALADPALVPAAVAAALGVAAGPGNLVAALAHAVRRRRLLLVLDNCEHLPAACARLALALLEGCPDLRILATSREALRLPGWERVYPVPPLALPPDVCATAEEVYASEAAQLFLQRAGLAPDVENAPLVARICRRLDGLPLALELAAARLPVLSLEQLATRLDRHLAGPAPSRVPGRLRLLAGENGAAPARQRTLDSTIAWSYDLLSPAVRILFRRLSVFSGGWTLEAAEAICGEGLGEVADGLAALVARSLVRPCGAMHGATVRLTMLQTIRAYALDRLAESGEDTALRRRHAAHYLSLAERAEPALKGPGQEAWLARLETEHDNLRTALRWSLCPYQGSVDRMATQRVLAPVIRTARGDAGEGEAVPDEGSERHEIGVRLAGALWRFWYLRGHLAEGATWLDAALSASDGGPSSPGRLRVLEGAGVLAALHGDHARSVALFRVGVAAACRTGDAAATAHALTHLGKATWQWGRLARAERQLVAAVALARRCGDARPLAYALVTLANVLAAQGQPLRALPLCEESLHIVRALGDRWAMADQLQTLGRLAVALGQVDQAARHYAEALALHRAVGEVAGIAACLEGLAAVACARGQAAMAASLLGQAAALREEHGAPLPPAERDGYERTVAAVHSALGEAALQAEWAAGYAAPSTSLVASLARAHGTPISRAAR